MWFDISEYRKIDIINSLCEEKKVQSCGEKKTKKM
jgi:hypothetical protein